MKKVLIFEGKDQLAEFIINHKKYGIVVNFEECTLAGVLTDGEVELACTSFSAHLSTASDFLLNDDAPSL